MRFSRNRLYSGGITISTIHGIASSNAPIRTQIRLITSMKLSFRSNDAYNMLAFYFSLGQPRTYELVSDVKGIT
jgi:hypothetical protein